MLFLERASERETERGREKREILERVISPKKFEFRERFAYPFPFKKREGEPCIYHTTRHTLNHNDHIVVQSESKVRQRLRQVRVAVRACFIIMLYQQQASDSPTSLPIPFPSLRVPTLHRRHSTNRLSDPPRAHQQRPSSYLHSTRWPARPVPEGGRSRWVNAVGARLPIPGPTCSRGR